jgi:tryptophan halogenase
MRDTEANAFRGKLENGEVVVEFGKREPGSAGTPIPLALRVAMPPATALRLASMLREALRAAPGAASTQAAPAPGAPPLQAVRGETPLNAPPDPAGEQAALLLQMVAGLGVPYQHERSLRLSPAGLHANRYLLSVNADDVTQPRWQRIAEICRRMGMPQAAQAEAAVHFDGARCVHFGFEGDGGTVVCKLYLERSVAASEAESARASGQPVLRHIAYKWPVSGGAAVTTRYLWHPELSLGQIEQKLTQLYGPLPDAQCLDSAAQALHLAAARVPAERLQYLEVEEAGNPRRSFDLNLYAAGLQVRDLQPQLARMRERFDVRPGHFQALYDQIKGRALGHLAGGIHRDGREFYTVYYGVAGFPRFAERLG